MLLSLFSQLCIRHGEIFVFKIQNVSEIYMYVIYEWS